MDIRTEQGPQQRPDEDHTVHGDGRMNILEILIPTLMMLVLSGAMFLILLIGGVIGKEEREE